MRIVVDISGYHLLNMGDVSMLQVAARRLKEFFPDAQLTILTSDPERLKRFVEIGEPLDPRSRSRWNESHLVPRFSPWLPKPISTYVIRNEHSVRASRPRMARRMAVATDWVTLRKGARSAAFAEAIERADLVVATGGGFLTDSFESEAMGIMQTLGTAQTFGIPTVMFGQGVGPVTSPRLLNRMREVLPRLEMIGVREQRGGVPLLREIGVAAERIQVTGDDAIELAHSQVSEVLGAHVGVNVRLSGYAGVSEDDRRIFSSTLKSFLETRGLSPRVVPISFHGAENDWTSTATLLNGHGDPAQGVVEDDPLAIVREVGQCRVILTGSYHAAVFALSQGIPVVGWARSAYYEDKFHGLADMFGGGCWVVSGGQEELGDQLHRSLSEAIDAAEAMRPGLLSQAKSQIARSRAAYASLPELMHGVAR